MDTVPTAQKRQVRDANSNDSSRWFRDDDITIEPANRSRVRADFTGVVNGSWWGPATALLSRMVGSPRDGLSRNLLGRCIGRASPWRLRAPHDTASMSVDTNI